MHPDNDFALEAWLEPGQEMFNFWISFFPTAPLFGVEWRFANMAGGPFGFGNTTAWLGPMAGPHSAAFDKKPEPEVEQAAVTVEETAKPAGPIGLMAAAPNKTDDLKQIKGIGPGLEKQLNNLGVFTFKQLAGFDKSDLEWIDENLTAFKGRCFRDDWVGQAKALMA